MGKRSTGLNPLSYMGVEATTPPQLIVKRKSLSPDENDVDFDLGTIWLDQESNAVWMLTDLDGGVATWTQLDIAEFSIVTDAGTATQDDGVIDILGQGVISTSGATNVVTIKLDQGTDGQLLVGATSAEGAWANVTSSGGTMDITEGANTLNIDVLGGVTGSTQFVTDAGTALVAGNIITVSGGTNINTAGATSVVTVNLDASPVVTGLTINGLSQGVVQADGAGVLSGSAGTNGQLLIGATGAAPDWGTVTSAAGTVVITGGANTLNLESTSGLSSPYVFYTNDDYAFDINGIGGDGSGNWVATVEPAMGTERFYYSADNGLTWDGGYAYTDADGLSDVHYGSDGYWVAVQRSVAEGPKAYWSTDPASQTWTRINIADGGKRVTHNGTYWVTVGTNTTAGGYPAWATDPAVAWTLASTGLTTGIYDVAYGNSTWVVVGVGGYVATQAAVPTGAWTPRTSGFGTTGASGDHIRAIAYSDTLTLFCAVGDRGIIITSPDGITWTQRSNVFSNSSTIVDITWDSTNSVFVAVSGSSEIGISYNGIIWLKDYKGFGGMICIGIESGEAIIGSGSVIKITAR